MPEHNPYASDASRARRDAITRRISERGDELRTRFETWQEQADAGDSEADMVADVIVDEIRWLHELAQAYDLDLIDRSLQRLTAELGHDSRPDPRPS